jgi:hypothetical protein
MPGTSLILGAIVTTPNVNLNNRAVNPTPKSHIANPATS